MQKNRLDENIKQSLDSKRKCLMPYITAGFPNLDVTMGLLDRFDHIGCPAVEIGFPFSDSIADGPVIQDSFNRALDAGFKIDALFERVGKVRPKLSTALIAMVSMSIVRRFGIDTFMKRASACGFDAVIVPDVPIDECQTIENACARYDLRNILMCAPTSSAQRQQDIAKQASGFVYVIAAKGITGERSAVDGQLPAIIGQLRGATKTPLIAGFGIASVEQVRDVCSVADGAIVGSAIIRRIREAVDQQQSNDETIKQVGNYVESLQAGTV
ncbi:MAG: tryptophan synthase alpha chain [Phycisphaerae bacterium]|nr:MAG: tryptophan synthase alpha chain [Phycisphaerae bacterium]